MYSVSADFNAKMIADLRRIDARVTVDYTDPTIDQSLAVEVSEANRISYESQVSDGITTATHKWASLDGTWRLDQDYRLAPKPEDLYRYQFGWWSASISGADGTFATPYPTLTVTHLPRPIYSLRVVGDSARGEYPVAFVIRLKDQSGNVLHTETVTNNTQVEWSKTLQTPVLDVARQELEIQKWSHPGRNAKILEFFTSIQETYYSDDIVEIKLLEEREASQGSLPVGNITANEISIRLANEGGKFDPTNPNSPLFRLLKPNRRIRAWLGVKGEGDGQNLTHTWDAQADWQAGAFTEAVATAVGTLEVDKVGDRLLAGSLFANGRLLNNGQGWTPYSPTAWVDSSGQWPFIHTEQQWDGVYQTINITQPGWYVVSYYVKHKSGHRYIGSHTDGSNQQCRFDRGPWRPGNIIDNLPDDGNWHLIEIKTYYSTPGPKQVHLQPGRSVVGVSEFYLQYARMEWAADQTNPEATVPDFVGTWTSQPVDLSPVGQAAASAISWQADTPPGTAVTVEASLDGGQTWATCANGGEIPGVLPGTNLTDKSLLVRATLSTTDTSVTPVLHSLTVQVHHEEWVPLGTFWSLDWDSPDDSLEASVVARDRLELLRKSTYQPGQVQQSVSLYTLAEQVLVDAGLKAGEYWIDPALQQIVIPWAWLSPTSHREALRTIAEAALAVVYADRDGVIRIESMGSVPDTPVLTITEDDYFPPLRAPSRQESVANEIVVTTQPLVPADTPQEVYRSTTPITVPAGQTVTVTVQFSQVPVIEASASLDAQPAGVNIVAATYYAWGAEVSIQNSGASQASVTLAITGKPLSVQGGEQVVARDEASILENGVLRYEYPANTLVQTLAQAKAIANALLASAKDPRRDIEVEWRGNPALELGDRVTVAGQDVHVIRQELQWSGALSARLTGRKVT